MEPQSALTGADILWKSLECPWARLSRPSAGMHSSFACVHPPRAPPPRRLAETGTQRPPRVAQQGGKPPDGHSELTPRGGKPPDGLSELTPRGRKPPDRLRADSPAGPLGCCALRVTLSPGPRCPRGAAQTLGGPGRGVSPAAAPPGFRLQETAGDGGDAFGIWSPAHASI